MIQVLPKFQFVSVITALTLVNVSLFTVTLSIGGVDESDLLACTTDALVTMGAKVPYLMRYESQVWRFATPMFLHVNLPHLLVNSLTLLVIGQSLEYDLGWAKFLALYLLAGMGGILFSAMCNDTLSAGASTAIFGLIGSYIACLIINWSYFKNHSGQRTRILIFLLFSVLIGL